MSTFAVGGVGLLTHQLQGERGEVVLLLNGSMMTFPSWALIAQPLHAPSPTGYRTLGCDFRGQLLSPGPGHRRLEENVDDLVALLDHLALDAVHVFGTSFGGEVGILFAATHPDRVRSLAAITVCDRTPPGMPEDSQRLQGEARRILAARDIGSALATDAGAFHDALVDGVYSARFRARHAEMLAERRAKVAELPRSWFEGLDGILHAVQDFDLGPMLGRIRCPTLVVHAAADAMMPRERVEAVARGIPGADFEVHPEAGHGLVIEDPEWVVRVYHEFLERRCDKS